MSPRIYVVKGNISRFNASRDPVFDSLELAEDDKEFWPELFAHEDAHRRLGHRDDKDDWEFPVEVFNDEIAAWDLALSRNKRFRKSIIYETLKTYLDMIGFQFSVGSPRYAKAKKQFDALFARHFGTGARQAPGKKSNPAGLGGLR